MNSFRFVQSNGQELHLYVKWCTLDQRSFHLLLVPAVKKRINFSCFWCTVQVFSIIFSNFFGSQQGCSCIGIILKNPPIKHQLIQALFQFFKLLLLSFSVFQSFYVTNQKPNLAFPKLKNLIKAFLKAYSENHFPPKMIIYNIYFLFFTNIKYKYQRRMIELKENTQPQVCTKTTQSLQIIIFPHPNQCQSQKNQSKIVLKQIFHDFQNSPTSTNANLITNLLNHFGHDQLQKQLLAFCLQQFQVIPLLVNYELAAQFKLFKLQQRCIEELLSENYEQLNYLQHYLLKLSFSVFQKLIKEYCEHVHNLDIRGFPKHELICIINLYCDDMGVQEYQKQCVLQTLGKKNTINQNQNSQAFLSMINVPNISTNQATISQKLSIKTTGLKADPFALKSIKQEHQSSIQQSIVIAKKTVAQLNQIEKQLLLNIQKTKQNTHLHHQQSSMELKLLAIEKKLINLQQFLYEEDDKIQKLKQNMDEMLSPQKVKDFNYNF